MWHHSLTLSSVSGLGLDEQRTENYRFHNLWLLKSYWLRIAVFICASGKDLHVSVSYESLETSAASGVLEKLD